MLPGYKKLQECIIEECEELPRARAPLRDYIVALKEIREEIDNWFEASIDAAEEDLKRQSGD